jgi:hypothetical protein
MKEQFVVTQRFTILQETEKNLPVLNRPTLKHVKFLRKKYGQGILLWTHVDRRCLVTQLSSNARILFDELCWLRQTDY